MQNSTQQNDLLSNIFASLLSKQQQNSPVYNQGLGSFLNTGGLQDVLGGLSGLAGVYFGSKQLGLAKDQYNTNKAFATTNLANQAQLINNTLEAKYRRALAAKQGTGEVMPTLEEYMNKSKVSGSIA